MLQNIIANKLLYKLSPDRMKLQNESSNHNVPEGSETHWNLIIVSDLFENKQLIERHRMIYDALGDEIRGGIHALTMKTLTLEEWTAAGGEMTNPAPLCLGGSA